MKVQKMKLTGYLCIGLSALLSLLMLIPGVTIESDIALPLVYFWTGTGITLLFGNAGKRLGGQVVENKHLEAEK